MTEKLNIPSVLGVRRALIVSDGLFYGVDAKGTKRLIPVIRHGIRGTQNQSKDAKEVNNIQQTESAKTFHDSCGLHVSFSFRPLPLMEGLTSCSGRDAGHFRAAFEGFVHRAKGGDGLREVCRRMARNVFNGRWLWRNRQLGSSIIVTATVGDVAEESADEDKANTWSQDALKTSLTNFDGYTKAEIALGDVFMDQFRGGSTQSIQVTAKIDLGMTGSVEVYPSQNYVNNKPEGFARPLYKVDVRKIYRNNKDDPDTFEDATQTGLAALRDQKIWNALRTIDTWYADYAETGLPIPVEPLGANLSADAFYRYYKNTSLFDLLPRLGMLDPDGEEGMFMIACLIRGGVFGVEDEERKAEKAAAKAEKDAKKAAKKVKVGNADSTDGDGTDFSLNGGAA